jgi:hypothetical protein
VVELVITLEVATVEVSMELVVWATGLAAR